MGGATASRTPTASGRRRPGTTGTVVRLRSTGVRPLAIVVVVVTVGVVATSVFTAPDPAPISPCWRSASVLVAVGLCMWNMRSAYVAFRRAGYLSAVGLLQLWVLFAFSFAAAEQTYRYGKLKMGYWEGSLDNAGTFRTVAIIGAFEVLFFLALGRDVALTRFVAPLRTGLGSPADRYDNGLSGASRSAPLVQADLRTAIIMVLLAMPFLISRIIVFAQLGLKTVAVTMVTRTDYFAYLGHGVNPIIWFFAAMFPVFGVSALCLAVRYAIPAATTAGAWCYSLVLTVCALASCPSGGRGDLAFVILTVLFAMRLHGYRFGRQFAPVAVPFVVVVGLLLLLAQARNGRDNTLTNLAGRPYVGDNYSSGDVTQLLGVGRYDAIVMIVDRHSPAANLGAQNYIETIKGALDSVFLPRVALGHPLGSRHVSRDVLGPWIFGFPKGSSLPSAPGELYLAFGLVGVLVGAVAFGLATRYLLRLAAGAPGPAQFTWVLLLWTVARAQSDESYLIGVFIAQSWPFVLLLGLVLRRRPLADRPAVAVSRPRSPVMPTDQLSNIERHMRTGPT